MVLATFTCPVELCTKNTESMKLLRRNRVGEHVTDGVLAALMASHLEQTTL